MSFAVVSFYVSRMKKPCFVNALCSLCGRWSVVPFSLLCVGFRFFAQMLVFPLRALTIKGLQHVSTARPSGAFKDGAQSWVRCPLLGESGTTHVRHVMPLAPRCPSLRTLTLSQHLSLSLTWTSVHISIELSAGTIDELSAC